MRTVIRAKDFELTDAWRNQVERRVRLGLTRFADRLDIVTVRIEQRVVPVGGGARYTCKIAMAPVGVQICEEHDRIETAIDRAIDRSARVAARLSRRHVPTPERGS